MKTNIINSPNIRIPCLYLPVISDESNNPHYSLHTLVLYLWSVGVKNVLSLFYRETRERNNNNKIVEAARQCGAA